MTFNHPFLFAAAAVVAIGIAIFEILSTQNERMGHRRRRDPPSPPKDDPPGPSSSKKSPKHPPTDSKRSETSRDNPPSPKVPKQPPTDYKPPSSPDNTLRKRNIDQTSLNKKSSDDLKKTTETPSTRDNQNIHTKEFDKNNFCKIMPDKSSSALRPSTPPANNSREHNFDQISSESSSNDLEKSTEISSTEACQDVQDKFNENNFSQNMLDKLNNDTKSFSKDLKSERNIFEEESSACESNSSPKDAKKSSNQTASDVDDYSKKDSCMKNMQSYKNEVYNTLLDDIHAAIEDYERKEDIPDELVIDPSGESKKQQPAESNICEACEENHIKTRAYPCNHSYLCVDCAVRIFRIYKKCKVCLQPVEEFVQFSS